MVDRDARVIELSASYREEDIEHTLIFVDMLGFAALTRKHMFRIVDREPEPGRLVSSTTPIQTQMNRFQRVLDTLLMKEALSGGLSAQIFSDCAFIDVGTFSKRGPEVAADLMRSFIEAEVPVRMGIGQGTYYVFRNSLDQADSQLVAKSLFAGTAVVNAHSAERCGGKGCRIFVHQSSEENLNYHHHDSDLITLPERAGPVGHEVCYLNLDSVEVNDVGPIGTTGRVVHHDDWLLERVISMRSASEPLDDSVALHYSETIDAIARMRLHRNRSLPRRGWP